MRKIYHPKKLELSAVLHALSDPMRLRIVKTIASSPEELPCHAFLCALAKPTMSHHFKVLKDAGITRIRIQGTKRYTSLCHKELNRAFPGLLKAILKSAK